MNKLFVVGFGVGDESLLTARAHAAIKSAQRVMSTARISRSNSQIQNYKLSELLDELSKPFDGTTAVLVSGDCCFFSVSKRIIEGFASQYDIELVSGISSVQYLSAKLAVPYDDALTVSMHGRNSRIVPKVCYNKKVFVLTGGEYKAHNICQMLCDSGLGGVNVSVGEKLSYADERIVCGKAEELCCQSFDDLSVMLVENYSTCDHSVPLCDDDFVRGDVPMTKEEVRWISLQKLCIKPSDIVYDIGAGTGSVAVEIARKAHDAVVYAIEAKAVACDLIRQNRRKHGAYNMQIIHATAPQGLAELPPPQAAFIGGSAGNMDEIVKCLVDKNPEVRIVANAVTLQSLNQILHSFKGHGFDIVDTICLNVAKARKHGKYDMMMAQNPVYIVAGRRGKQT